MRDYDNMPTLQWSEEHAADKASMQIRRQEPVILMMDPAFRFEADLEASECELDEASGISINCQPEVLRQMARHNAQAGLEKVADIATEASQRIDVDVRQNRLIIHD